MIHYNTQTKNKHLLHQKKRIFVSLSHKAVTDARNSLAALALNVIMPFDMKVGHPNGLFRALSETEV